MVFPSWYYYNTPKGIGFPPLGVWNQYNYHCLTSVNPTSHNRIAVGQLSIHWNIGTIFLLEKKLFRFTQAILWPLAVVDATRPLGWVVYKVTPSPIIYNKICVFFLQNVLQSAYYKQPYNATTLNFDSLRYNQAHLADNQKNSIYSFETKKTSVQGRLLRNSKENVSLSRRKYTTTQTVSREKDVSPQSSEKESWDSHMSDWTINFCRPHFSF